MEHVAQSTRGDLCWRRDSNRQQVRGKHRQVGRMPFQQILFMQNISIKFAIHQIFTSLTMQFLGVHKCSNCFLIVALASSDCSFCKIHCTCGENYGMQLLFLLLIWSENIWKPCIYSCHQSSHQWNVVLSQVWLLITFNSKLNAHLKKLSEKSIYVSNST